MVQCWQGVLLQGALLLSALGAAQNFTTPEIDLTNRGSKKFGDKCSNTGDCGFDYSVCEPFKGICQCSPDYPATNHIDKCGKGAQVNESCSFEEQCEAFNDETECRDGICLCRFDKQAVIHEDGSSECIAMKEPVHTEEYVAPTMIGILVAMCVMVIIICVVLQLFSRERWRENRTIFNTPNPRLMNVSLLRDSKILHQERRGSRGSIRAPSRQPSMASLHAHSPNSQESRRGSKESNSSNKDQFNGNTANAPILESVTVEIRDPKD